MRPRGAAPIRKGGEHGQAASLDENAPDLGSARPESNQWNPSAGPRRPTRRTGSPRPHPRALVGSDRPGQTLAPRGLWLEGDHVEARGEQRAARFPDPARGRAPALRARVESAASAPTTAGAYRADRVRRRPRPRRTARRADAGPRRIRWTIPSARRAAAHRAARRRSKPMPVARVPTDAIQRRYPCVIRACDVVESPI